MKINNDLGVMVVIIFVFGVFVVVVVFIVVFVVILLLLLFPLLSPLGMRFTVHCVTDPKLCRPSIFDVLPD